MGYESVLEIRGAAVRKKHIEAVRAAIRKARRKKEPSDLQRHLAEMTVSDDGDIEFEEYWGKWYGSDELALFLAPFVLAGQMHLHGEDGDCWGYEFDGKGKVYELTIVWCRTGPLAKGRQCKDETEERYRQLEEEREWLRARMDEIDIEMMEMQEQRGRENGKARRKGA
jgi:hypothetical protein